MGPPMPEDNTHDDFAKCITASVILMPNQTQIPQDIVSLPQAGMKK